MAVPVATVATEGMVSAVVEASATAAQAARVVAEARPRSPVARANGPPQLRGRITEAGPWYSPASVRI